MKKLLLSLSLFGFAATSVFTLPKLLQRELFKVYEIENVDFNLTWEDLRIEECDEEENILIEIYCNKQKFAPKIKTKDSTLMVQSNADPSSPFVSKKCTVIAKIPSTASFEKFHMSTSSGSIRSQMVITSENFTSSSTSGSQSISVEIFAKNAKVNSTSGSIFLETVFGDNLQVSASSGSVNVNGFDGKNISIETSSGSIKLRKAKLDKAIVKASSGSISIEGQILDAFDVSASSGSIGMELDDAPLSNSRVKTTSGSIFIGLPGNADFSLWAQTTSGTFVNALTRDKISGHADYSKDINNGGATVILSSTSGSITIDSNNGTQAKVREPSIDPDIPVVSFDDPIF